MTKQMLRDRKMKMKSSRLILVLFLVIISSLNIIGARYCWGDTILNVEAEPNTALPNTFVIKAVFSGEVNWRVKVLDKNGDIVKSFQGGGCNVNQIWDGTDIFGGKVSDGEYLIAVDVVEIDWKTRKTKVVESKKAGRVVIEGTKDVPDYIVWAEQNTVKVKRHDVPHYRFLRRGAIHIKAARNEYESFQIVVTPVKKELKRVDVRASDLRGEGGKIFPKENIEFFLVHYIHVHIPSRRYYRMLKDNFPAGYEGTGDWPDGLPPFKPFNIGVEEGNQPIWVALRVPKDTAAGDYMGTVTIQLANAESVKISLKLTVWDFTLSEETHMRSGFPYSIYPKIENVYPPGSEEYTELKDRYYWWLLERRMTPMDIPVPLTSPEAESYLNDPRVTAFRIPYTKDEAELERTVRHLEKKGWLKKGYMYFIDEPSKKEFDKVRQAGEWLHSIDMDIRFLVTVPPDPELFGYVDIWCPAEYRGGETGNQARQTLGEEIWWYANGHIVIDFPGMFHRLVFWVQARYKIDGFITWHTNYWSMVKDPWKDALTQKYGTLLSNGQGSYVYPGAKVGVFGPVSSIRLELMREGIEDFEYFWLLERKIDMVKRKIGGKGFDYSGYDRVKDICAQLVVTPSRFLLDPWKLQELRQEVAEEILSLDKIPLLLVKINYPESQIASKSPVVEVSGIAEEGASIAINSKTVPLKGSLFKTAIVLNKGVNRIRVVARMNGKEKVITRTIFKHMMY